MEGTLSLWYLTQQYAYELSTRLSNGFRLHAVCRTPAAQGAGLSDQLSRTTRGMMRSALITVSSVQGTTPDRAVLAFLTKTKTTIHYNEYQHWDAWGNIMVCYEFLELKCSLILCHFTNTKSITAKKRYQKYWSSGKYNSKILSHFHT